MVSVVRYRAKYERDWTRIPRVTLERQRRHSHAGAWEREIKTWINGVAAADLKNGMTPKGFIALQVHSSKEPESKEVAWRNIRIKVLD